VTPIVGAAGCGRFLAIVCENTFSLGTWMLRAPEYMPAGGARETFQLQKMWASLEDWNERGRGTGRPRVMRMFYCALPIASPEHVVIQRATARVETVTPGRLAELMGLGAAQAQRRRLADDQVVKQALAHLGSVPDGDALQALDFALSCFAVAHATQPIGHC
jgi:hypothetical protein